MTPMLFLDFDGVLNDRPTWTGHPVLYAIQCARLQEILMVCPARIVLTTAWAKWIADGSMSVTGMNRLLQTHGVKDASVIGDVGPHILGDLASRMRAIDEYIREHGQKGIPYAILDDLPLPTDRLIRTHPDDGLRAEHVMATADMLRRPIEPDARRIEGEFAL